MDYIYSMISHIVMQWVNKDFLPRKYNSGKNSHWEYSRKFYSALGNGPCRPPRSGNEAPPPPSSGSVNVIIHSKKVYLEEEVGVEVDIHESDKEISVNKLEEKSPGVAYLNLLIEKGEQKVAQDGTHSDMKEIISSKDSSKGVIKEISLSPSYNHDSMSKTSNTNFISNASWGSSKSYDIPFQRGWDKSPTRTSGWNKKDLCKDKDKVSSWSLKPLENSLQPGVNLLDLKSYDPTDMHDTRYLRMTFENARACIQNMEVDKLYFPVPMFKYYEICSWIGKDVYTNAMRQDEDIFHISDKRSTQRAIQFSVFMTKEKLCNYYNNDKLL